MTYAIKELKTGHIWRCHGASMEECLAAVGLWWRLFGIEARVVIRKERAARSRAMQDGRA